MLWSTNPTFSHMHLSGLPFQIQKILHVWQGWNPIFLCITTWWPGLGWHQRRPAFTSCSATGFLCKVSLNALHFHMDTAVSSGVASATVTHTAGTDVNVKVDKKCTRTAAVFQQLREDLPISLWLTQEQKSASMMQKDGSRSVRTHQTPPHQGCAWALAASGCLCSGGAALLRAVL